MVLTEHPVRSLLSVCALATEFEYRHLLVRKLEQPYQTEFESLPECLQETRILHCWPTVGQAISEPHLQTLALLELAKILFEHYHRPKPEMRSFLLQVPLQR